jgi:hypothetical protein
MAGQGMKSESRELAVGQGQGLGWADLARLGKDRRGLGWARQRGKDWRLETRDIDVLNKNTRHCVKNKRKTE